MLAEREREAAMEPELSPQAEALLRRMNASPETIRYHTDLLGGMFRAADVGRLDAAYRELEAAGLIERTGRVLNFFGEPKPLYRLTDKGHASVTVKS
jgi:DNA-binding PadR family transcriptional regulator